MVYQHYSKIIGPIYIISSLGKLKGFFHHLHNMTQKLHHIEILSYFAFKKFSHLFYNYFFIHFFFSL